MLPLAVCTSNAAAVTAVAKGLRLSTVQFCCCVADNVAVISLLLLLPQGEDDGFLLVYVYEAGADASFLHVYNAQTMDNKPLAVVSRAAH
jgi:carotenoid cleavage dioxygenase-like enzyme